MTQPHKPIKDGPWPSGPHSHNGGRTYHDGHQHWRGNMQHFAITDDGDILDAGGNVITESVIRALDWLSKGPQPSDGPDYHADRAAYEHEGRARIVDEVDPRDLFQGAKSPGPVNCDQAGPDLERLDHWWQHISEQDFLQAVPKAEEYGSVDLEMVGRMMATMLRWEGLDSAQHAELGVAFHVLSKVARLFSAYEMRKMPSGDTWHDVTVYSMMGRRIRWGGAWPGRT